MDEPVITGRTTTRPLDDVVCEALTARVTVDERGRVTGWNAGAERLLGYAAEEIVGRPAGELLAEPVPAEDLPPFAQLPRWHGNLSVRHRDGRRLEIKVLAHHRTPERERAAAPGADVGGGVRAGAGAGAGEWLLVSAMSGQQPEPLDDTFVTWSFAQSPCCALALYDTRLRLRRANADMERSVALTEQDMLGLRVNEIVDGPAGDRAEQSMARVLETGEPQYNENFLRTAGETREHAWSVFMSTLRDATGEVRGVCLTAHDTTEQYWARKRLQLIAEAGRRIGTTLDVMRTAQELADVTVPELADFVSVDLLTSLDDLHEPLPQAGTLASPLVLRRAAHQSVTPGLPEAVVALGEADEYPEGSAPVETLRSGRAAVYEMTHPAITALVARDPARASRAREFGMHSVMVVPLSARGTTLGVAILVRHRRAKLFQQDDVVLAEELAARAAVCIDNARRYTRERGTAVMLQRSLLPQRLPEQAAVEVASRYLPAGVHAGVGGDWFDVIPLSGARVALVVGDIVGHGIHASATMGRLRTAVRTLADIDLPPDELLTHLDDLVARLSTEREDDRTPADRAPETRAGGEVGATCLYAVYDPITQRCCLARAGHPLPAVVSPDGVADLVDIPASPPLGLGGLPFESAEIDLPEGSLLALYTNGLLESPDRDIDDGIRRLRHLLTGPEPTLDALCDRILTDLLPPRPSDDVALLMARTRALDASQVATWGVPSDPSAVAQTRKDALAQLEAWGLEDAAFVTELVVSELVTNAIRHAEPPIQLRLIHLTHDDSLICEVSDGGNTAPHLRRARSYDEGGRGLLLVAQLTQRWGTRQSAKGKTIWAEQHLEPAPPDVF
ncbi:PAS/PAC sensor protein [Streptomyces viridochromogenes]|uniref:PAS/PAC sensor protein n=1 Tax=Streptomyces viridochromogenes TaxID=1938 RepID=A0A0J7ZED1_STRVR|nr:SpoIIE family protein phosphatase [Streptomyces viridochromogenes]KMS73548.1 PAS/PAC sensor protein [Streptomyces viridochromogenes]